MRRVRSTAARLVRAAAALGLAAMALAAFGQQCPSTAPVFADEFNGTKVDLAKWEVQTGDGCS